PTIRTVSPGLIVATSVRSCSQAKCRTTVMPFSTVPASTSIETRGSPFTRGVMAVTTPAITGRSRGGQFGNTVLQNGWQCPRYAHDWQFAEVGSASVQTSPHEAWL